MLHALDDQIRLGVNLDRGPVHVGDEYVVVVEEPDPVGPDVRGGSVAGEAGCPAVDVEVGGDVGASVGDDDDLIGARLR